MAIGNMNLKTRMLEGIDVNNFKCIVIGAGICGSIAARRLSEMGHDVLVLQAGPDTGDKRIDFAGNYARALAKHPGSPYSNLGPGDVIGPDNNKAYYTYTHDSTKFLSSFLRIGGGSTWHFMGNVPRFIPEDFKLLEKYQVGANWPIDYDDIETEYCEAEREMGVSGDHEQWNDYLEAWRSSPYPMHKIWQCYGDTIFLERVNNLVVKGKQIKVMSTPQARNSTIYDGRPACAGNSSCVPICPIQAKYDATVTMRNATKAVVSYDTVVKKLIPGPGGNIEQIHCIDARSRTERTIMVNDRFVILAAHAIETPRLLIYSGLAKKSGQVGKNLMDHLQGYCTALAEKPVYPFRGPITTSGIDAFRQGDHRKEFSAFRMSIGNDGWGRTESPHKTLWATLQSGQFGKSLVNTVRERVTRMIRISFSTEMLPDRANYVDLSNSEFDQFGIPRPRLRFSFPDYNKLAFNFAYKCSSEIMRAAGCQVDDSKWDPTKYSGAGHIIGTTRMGESHTNSVVNSYGMVHEHANLYIAGPSIFPTSGTANPTLTAAALTFRMMKHLSPLL